MTSATVANLARLAATNAGLTVLDVSIAPENGAMETAGLVFMRGAEQERLTADRHTEGGRWMILFAGVVWAAEPDHDSIVEACGALMAAWVVGLMKAKTTE